MIKKKTKAQIKLEKIEKALEKVIVLLESLEKENIELRLYLKEIYRHNYERITRNKDSLN